MVPAYPGCLGKKPLNRCNSSSSSSLLWPNGHPSQQLLSSCYPVLIICDSNHTTTILRPFFQDHPGEMVPEENFWTLWCKGGLTEADTPTIRLGATPSGLSSAHLHYVTAKYLMIVCSNNALLNSAVEPDASDVI